MVSFNIPYVPYERLAYTDKITEIKLPHLTKANQCKSASTKIAHNTVLY